MTVDWMKNPKAKFRIGTLREVSRGMEALSKLTEPPREGGGLFFEKASMVFDIEAWKIDHRVWSTLFGKTSLDQTEYGFFAIDWEHPDPEIKRAFGIWLAEQRAFRKTAGLPGPKFVSRSRGGFRDQLRWLGALRVRNYYTAKELGGYADSNLKVDAPYSHLPDLYANAKKAEALLAELFPASSS